MDPFASAHFSDLKSLSIKELRAQCSLKGVSTEGCFEKADLIEALETAAAPSTSDGDAAMEMDVDVGNASMGNTASATAADKMDEDEEDEDEDEEALLAQALLMSNENESGLNALPIKELRQRAMARCVDIRGITEKADLVAALLGSEADASPPPPPLQAMADGTGDDVSDPPPPGVEVIARFPMRFACFTAADVGLGNGLEHAGKVMLPSSCLMALSFLGDLPSTMLLRMSFHERSVHVGVADFMDDGKIFDATSQHGHSVPVWGPAGRAVAAVIVPRWVRSQLGCVNGDEPMLSLVSLPKASFMQLTPHTDAFAAALGKCADPRAVLTQLMNKFVSVSVGDVIHLVVPGSIEGGGGGGSSGGGGGDGGGGVGSGGSGDRIEDAGGEEATERVERHALEVSALRGLPGVRCGLPEGSAQLLDVSAALQGVLDGGIGRPKGVAVRAACLVDADVECDFAPSFETTGREEAEARAKAEAAEAERAALLEAAQREERQHEERRLRREAARSALALLPTVESTAAVGELAARAGGTITCAVRCPDGTRLMRKFSRGDEVLACFQLVEAEWNEPEGAALLPVDFCLVTRQPRRCLRRAECEAAGTTFEQAGLSSTQEALFVETNPSPTD